MKKIIFFLLFFNLHFAQAKSSSQGFLIDYKADLENVANYLNGIKNLSANFTQKSVNGNTEGKFYLSRPGKMRVEYADNPKILIVVNGSVLSYKDIELDEVSNISTNTTPASFLTRQNISFNAKDVEITNVKKTADKISISLIKKNRTDAGEFTIIFKTSPNISFAQMKIKNDLDETTIIDLQNISFPQNLGEELFTIRNKNLPL